MSTIERAPDVTVARRLRHREAVDHLDYLREIRRLSALMTQAELARELGVTQPAISQTLKSARTVPDPPAGFSGATPYEIAQRYTAGEIGRDQLVDELSRWPYRPREASDGLDWLTYVPGEWEDTVVKARTHGLITNEIYDEILTRVERPITS